MIGLHEVYLVAGLMFGGFALASAYDLANPKRWNNAAFWGLFALSFLFGDQFGDLANGVLVIAMVLIAGVGGLGQGAPRTTSAEERRASSAKLGMRLLVPALAIPLVTLVCVLGLKGVTANGQPLIEAKHATLVALTGGALAAVLLGVLLLRQPISAAAQEGRRLMDTVGWAALLPQMLASLGAVFALSGVGPVIGDIAKGMAISGPLVSVAAYCIGMALFTMIMGNAFAAFPVMTAGLGLPLIVTANGGDPVAMSAIGMLAGFCGTLMTPMAANFNLVPAALLELHDRNAVIKVQTPTALALLAFNIVLMALVVYR
ncbi:DUF979 domain-containing protein [Nevskia sp.]|uniref:DUF979 domain-containing protein n=1 Tax=Nevskia sp. TaxID=1929292 RepID=UPI0025DF7FC1|nr:DUF979 domain-containing protein [Nevskia sp.]